MSALILDGPDLDQMAKKKAARKPDSAVKPSPIRKQKLATRVSDADRRTKTGGEQLPLSAFMLDLDNQKLDAIADEFCLPSRTGAARIAIKRWHRAINRLAERSLLTHPARPELEQTVGRQEGNDMKFYVYREDMDRLKHLAELTGCKQMGRLIRASIGWLYENLDS